MFLIMEIKTKHLHIGEVIHQSIDLPVLEIGSGRPLIGIVGGVHGDEPESLFVMRELLKRLDHFSGTLRLLPGVNLFALAFRMRETPFDHEDLNRAFPGKKDGTFTERIAYVLFQEFLDCDLVIDIHGVGNLGEFMGMEFSTQDPLLVEKTRNFIRLLQPPMVWRAVEGSKYLTSFIECLLARGVLGTGVELPPFELLNTERMNGIVNGLLSVLKSSLDTSCFLAHPIPVFSDEQRYFSDTGGLYTPIMNILSPVRRGDVIGVVTDLLTFQDRYLTSLFDGFLSVQSSRKVLVTGEKVYVVAKKIGEIS